MRLLTVATLGVAMAALSAGAALAQEQYPPSSYGNYQSYEAPDYPTSGYQSYSQDYAPPVNDNYYRNGGYQNGYYQNAPTRNAQSYRDYQNAMSAYDSARNTAAREGQNYDRNSADYMTNQRRYRRQLREYNDARMAYDDQYGAGAYEEYYTAPVPPPY